MLAVEEIIFKLKILQDSGVDSIEKDNDVVLMIKALEKLK